MRKGVLDAFATLELDPVRYNIPYQKGLNAMF